MEGNHFTRRKKIGYGIASIGDTAVYNLLIIYSLFFMTDVVKMDPLTAGNIIFFATIWNAFSVGLIGYLSDHIPLKGGKRLPYMKLSILPMSITLVMFFSIVNGSLLLMAGYYTLVMAVLMTAHSNFLIPYEALGADLTMNSDERTDLRSYARFFMGVGNLAGVVFLLPFVEKMETLGMETSRAWQTAIFTIALISAVSQIITCRTFKGETKIGKCNIKDEKSEKILKEYWNIIKIKPFRQLLLVTLLLCIANVFCNSGIAYFMKYNLGIPEASKALVLGVMTCAGIIMTPILAATSKKYDKKRIMSNSYIFTGCALLLLGLIKIPSLFILCIYIVILTIGTSAYWQLIYGMLYDISEVDEYENNRRREATILSMSKIVLKISNACATQMLALVLFWFDYDQNLTQQSVRALFGIQCSLTIIPGILFLSAAICVIRYPISEAKHLQIVEELKSRKR